MQNTCNKFNNLQAFLRDRRKDTQNPSDLEAKVTKTNRNNKSKYNLSQKINKGHNALKFPYLFEYVFKNFLYL